MSNELMNTNGNFAVAAGNNTEIPSYETEGITPTFEKVKIPSGGGISFEVPSDTNETDSVKEIRAIIVYHHPANAYYKEKFTGGNVPPDCSSFDNKGGIVKETGEYRKCSQCEFNQFGSGENGGRACKQKRRLFILMENHAMPYMLTVPTGSLGEFTKYITHLLSKGKRSNSVVTKITLKKAQNSTGITYSQLAFSMDGELSPDLRATVNDMTEEVMAIARNIQDADED